MKRIFIGLIGTALLASSAQDILAQTRRATSGFSTTGKTVKVFTTAQDSAALRLSWNGIASFNAMPQPLETQLCIFVDPNKTFQTFLGIGGALTDAAAETFAKLPKDKQAEFMIAYFDKEKGIGYNFARTNIHSCDFSSDTYTYITEGDAALKSFNIQHDKQFKIPFIKKAIAAAGGKLTLFASPWSPPAFMKTNKDILHGGKLKKEFYQ
ncbi:MAG: hypothetical protein WCG67_03020, partial [Ferruginibacter sp.]